MKSFQHHFSFLRKLFCAFIERVCCVVTQHAEILYQQDSIRVNVCVCVCALSLDSVMLVGV